MNGCRKVRYGNELAAKIALARLVVGRGAEDHAEKRAYRCPKCRGWHLTSMTAPSP